MAKRLKSEATTQQTLFALPTEDAPSHRPQEFTRTGEVPGLLLGTSSFTAAGWQGTFYPEGMRSQEFLPYYAQKFRTVEIDSTFYGTPRASTVLGWKDKTPPDFVFALKVPQVVTHEKILVGCEPEFDEFVEAASLLGNKLGPMLFQFPKFDKWMLKDVDALLGRMEPFLARITNRSLRFAVEIRNKPWLTSQLADFLRERNVALALTDTSFLPRPWELKQPIDLATADFLYVRWLGDRKGIEKITTAWNETVVDRTADLKEWRTYLKALTLERKFRHLFLFANNHYAGFAPATVEFFRKIWTELD